MSESTNFSQSTLSDKRQVLLDTLGQVPLFAHLPNEQLQWLSEQGTEIQLRKGELIACQGDPPDGFYIILDGKTEWTRKVGQQEVHVVNLEAGTVFAELILLLDQPYPTSGRALTAVRLYKLTKDAFFYMLSRCPSIQREILKISAQRSQLHESVSQQHAKLISLGTMAAGLAHELNNPAAAVRRSSKGLHEIFRTLSNQAFQLNQWQMTPAQQAFIASLPLEVIEHAQTSSQLDPLTQSDRCDEIADWLYAHDVTKGWKLAPTLVGAGLDTDWLTQLTTRVPPGSLGDVLSWLEAAVTGESLIGEIEQSSTRISTLVNTVKEYSYMDQAPLQEVDVHEGIENTLKILEHKLKTGSIVVTREYDSSLPPIWAFGSELNQVWTNLINNAIDALDGSGQIWIRTFQEPDRVLVEIADNGHGIPSDIQPRIFEPFFTTKSTGEGTGLGLDISRRIVVGQHKGDIRVTSKLGDTRVAVRLPLELRQLYRPGASS